MDKPYSSPIARFSHSHAVKVAMVAYLVANLVVRFYRCHMAEDATWINFRVNTILGFSLATW